MTDTIVLSRDVDHIHVVPLADGATGHAPGSAYAETFWLPVIGPSALLCGRRLFTWLELSPEGADVDLGVLAAALGIGSVKRLPIHHTLTRLAVFGLAEIPGPRLYRFRTVWPELSGRHVARLPDHLQALHKEATNG